MLKWILTRELARFITGSNRVGLRKVQFFQSDPLNPLSFFYNFFIIIITPDYIGLQFHIFKC